MSRMSRRRVLQGLGGLTLALPFLHKFHRPARAGGNPPPVPKRLVVMAYPMGTVVPHARPDAAGSSFTLPYITAPLEPWRDRCVFVSNCDNAVMHLNDRHAFGHPGKKEGALTGTLLTSAFGNDGSNVVGNVVQGAPADETSGPNGESVCNYIGGRIRTASQPRRSIDVGVTGSIYESNEVPSSFAFEGRANPVSLQLNPARAFEQIFSGFSGTPDPALEARRNRGLSVLDAVHDSFTDLRQGLDARDRAILDDHADHVRELEQRLRSMAGATCDVPAMPPTEGSPPSYVPYRNLPMTTLAGYQIPLLARGLGCDVAPVGRLEFTGQQNPPFGVASVDTEIAAWNAAASDWHGMVHGDPSPVSGMPTRPPAMSGGAYAQPLLDGYRFFVERFADLLSALDGIPEGEPGLSALDHTLCVLVSDFGEGSGHSSNKMFWVLAGNTGPARRGYHAVVGPDAFYQPSTHNTNQLLVSIIRMFGLTQPDGSPISEFGLGGFTSGVIDELF